MSSDGQSNIVHSSLQVLTDQCWTSSKLNPIRLKSKNYTGSIHIETTLDRNDDIENVNEKQVNKAKKSLHEVWNRDGK